MAFKAGAVYGEAVLDTKKWNTGLKNMISGATKAAGAIAAVFVAGMTKSIMAADEFQQSMSNVATIVDDTAVSTQDLTMQLLQLDPALGTTTELTDALYQAFSAGAEDAEEAMDITIQAAQFGKAALTETEAAVDILTTAMNAYGTNVVDAQTASDLFFTTIKEGKITGDQLSSSIGQSIPLFASMNIGLDELSAGLATMTKQGISANEATTQLNAIVNSFIKPSDEMTAALQSIGFESGAAFIESEGLAGALEFLEQQTGGNADELSKLIPNIRGLKGIMALTGEGGDIFAETMIEMGDSVGATTEAFDKQEKTFDTFSAAMDKVQIVVGNIGKHFIDQIAVGATVGAQSMLQFIMSSEGMELVSQTVGTVAGLFDALVVAVTPIINTVGDALSEIWTELTELGEVLAGETAEGAGAFNLLAIVSESAVVVLTVLGKIISGVIENISNMADIIMKSADVIGGFFDALSGTITWDEFGERMDEAGQAVETFAVEAFDNVAELVESTMDGLFGLGKAVEETATEMNVTYTSTFDNMSNMVSNSWGEMITGQQDFVGDLTNNLDQIPGAFEEMLEGPGGVIDLNEDAVEQLKFTWKDYFDEIMMFTQFFTTGMTNIFSMFLDNRLAELDNSLADELAALQENYAQGLITEEEFNAQKQEIEAEALEKENEIREKMFKLDKVNKIASVWIDAASSIAGWWAIGPDLGPIAGPAFVATMTAATLAMAGVQTGLIAGQEFVPAREKGGMASGLTRINERGGEIVTLPDNSQVIPADVSSQIAENIGSGRNMIMNVSFAGAHISDNMDLNIIVEKVSRKLGQQMRLAT
jgi:TP901 family phage tail tape measure protein